MGALEHLGVKMLVSKKRDPAKARERDASREISG